MGGSKRMGVKKGNTGIYGKGLRVNTTIYAVGVMHNDAKCVLQMDALQMDFEMSAYFVFVFSAFRTTITSVYSR